MFLTTLILLILNGFLLAGALYWKRDDRLQFLASWQPWKRLMGWPAVVSVVIILLDLVSFALGLLSELKVLRPRSHPLVSLPESDILQSLAFLASLALLLPMVMTILARERPFADSIADKQTMDMKHAMYGVLFVAIVLAFEGIKTIVSAGAPSFESLGPAALALVAVPLYVASITLSRAASLGRSMKPHPRHARIHESNVSALLMGAVLLRSILAWAGAILVLPRLTRRVASWVIARLTRTGKVAATAGDSFTLLARVMFHTNTWRSVTFHCFFAAGYPMLLFLQAGEGPLGTRVAGYAYSSTLVGLYTAVSVLILATLVARRGTWWLAGIAIGLWFFVLYGLPLLAPRLMAPAAGASLWQAPMAALAAWHGSLAGGIAILCGLHITVATFHALKDHARLAMWRYVDEGTVAAAATSLRCARCTLWADKAVTFVVMAGLAIIILGGPTMDVHLRDLVGAELDDAPGIGAGASFLLSGAVLLLLLGFVAFWTFEVRRDRSLQRENESLMAELRLVASLREADGLDTSWSAWTHYGTRLPEAAEWQERRRVTLVLILSSTALTLGLLLRQAVLLG